MRRRQRSRTRKPWHFDDYDVNDYVLDSDSDYHSGQSQPLMNASKFVKYKNCATYSKNTGLQITITGNISVCIVGKNSKKREIFSVTSARAREELLQYQVRSQSVGVANDSDTSSRPARVSAQQLSTGNSSARRQRSFRRTEEELLKRSRAQTVDYELSQDLQDKQTEILERRYGGSVRSRRAAKTIQRAYRQYCMSKNFQKLRNSVAERRLSKLSRSNTVWSDKIVSDIHYTMGATVIQNNDLTNKRNLDMYVNDPMKRLLDTNESVQMKQYMSLDQGYNMPKMCVSGQQRKLEHSHEVDVIETGNIPNDSRLKHLTEENNSRNSCPEMNYSDCTQDIHLKSVGDLHSIDFETIVDNKDTNSLGDSFRSDTSHDINAAMLGSRASRVSLASSNLSTDMLGSNKSINYSYENFVAQSESSDSSSVSSIQIDGTKDSASTDQSKTREQECMHEQTIKYMMNSSEIKYRSQKESVQNKVIYDNNKQPPIPGRVMEPSPIWKRKNDSLSDSTGSVGKLDMKRMSNISETSEANSENRYSSSLSSENVSIENISVIKDGISHQRRLRESITPDHLGHAIPKYTDKHHKRIYRIGLNLFNKKPEKGLAFLIEQGFINESPETVARFLITRKGLSKQMIGEYLGNLQNQFNMAVLCYFCEEIDLSGLQVDMALRKFQSYFRMPGEAQKIERLMEPHGRLEEESDERTGQLPLAEKICQNNIRMLLFKVFAERYISCNPDQVKNFKNQETILLLAFAIIMLNTDLHNASIKPERKMKLEDFIKNLRGIDDYEDVDRDLLVGIYERIKNQEFRPGVDHVTQVMKVEQTIVGNNKPALAQPHRRLVCYCRLYQVLDPNKKERISLHQREVFLFNDLLLVTKIFSKKKTGITYAFKQSCSLCDMLVTPLPSTHYQFGVKLVNNLDGKVLIIFNARNDHDLQKFIEDLKEAILECNGMEQLRIDEQQLKNSNHVPLDRLYSNDDTRIDNYDYMKMPDPNCNRLSAPDYNNLRQSFPLSNSLTDLCGAQAMHRGSSGCSLDSGIHSGSTGSANSTEASIGSRDSQSSVMKGHVSISATISTPSKRSSVRGKISSTNSKQTCVPAGTHV